MAATHMKRVSYMWPVVLFIPAALCTAVVVVVVVCFLCFLVMHHYRHLLQSPCICVLLMRV